MLLISPNSLRPDETLRMKLSYFLVLSAAFHALVLALPVFRTEAEKERLFPVTIVALAAPETAWPPQPETSRQNKPMIHPKPLPPIAMSEGIEAKAAETTPSAHISEPIRPAAERLEGASVPNAAEANAEPTPREAPRLDDSERPFAVETIARRDSTATERSTIADVGPGTANKNQHGAAKEAAGAGAVPAVEIAAAREMAKAHPKRASGELGQPVGEPDGLIPSPRAATGRERVIPEPAAGSDRTAIFTSTPVQEKRHTALFSSPRYSHNPPPEYPESARRDGSEGTVFLAVLVDAQGNPEKIEISQSSGARSLDEAATKSVRAWRFHPARQGERPVESWVKVPVVFQLAGR